MPCIKGWLIGRLSVAGHGSGQPVASSETAEGQARNRRTEFPVKYPGRAVAYG